MALAMMQSARQNAGTSIDRYVIFTDRLNRKVPKWIELIQLESNSVNDKFVNWSLKPKIFRHAQVTNDVLLFVDADTTIYRDVLDLAFDWIENRSLLLLINFVPDEEPWGPYNLGNIYRLAGYDAQNIVLNSGIVGIYPNALGRRFQSLWERLMNDMPLEKYFKTPSYKLADEPYAGLAYQLSFQELGLQQPEKNHPFDIHDYVFTVGANPKRFYEKPGPVVHVPWYSEPITQPAIIHWVECTQYAFYRATVWYYLSKTGLLPRLFPQIAMTEMNIFRKRLKRKLRALIKGTTNALG
jgi:hypothetical protein